MIWLWRNWFSCIDVVLNQNRIEKGDFFLRWFFFDLIQFWFSLEKLCFFGQKKFPPVKTSPLWPEQKIPQKNHLKKFNKKNDLTPSKRYILIFDAPLTRRPVSKKKSWALPWLETSVRGFARGCGTSPSGSGSPQTSAACWNQSPCWQKKKTHIPLVGETFWMEAFQQFFY